MSFEEFKNELAEELGIEPTLIKEGRSPVVWNWDENVSHPNPENIEDGLLLNNIFFMKKDEYNPKEGSYRLPYVMALVKTYNSKVPIKVLCDDVYNLVKEEL